MPSDCGRNLRIAQTALPELKMILVGKIQGLRAGDLHRIANDQKLFEKWDTKMRYAPHSDIKPKWVTAWRASAYYLVSKMDLG
jgi:hypothetical protein